MKRKPKWIAAISPSKRASVEAYNREARRVVMDAQERGVECPVALAIWGEIWIVTEIHHARGKLCEALRHDKRGWFLVCRKAHSWIDRNRQKAQSKGWLCPLGKWGSPFRSNEPPMPGSVAEMEAKNLLRPAGTDAKV